MAAEVRAGSRASRHHPSETERYVHSVTPLLVTPGGPRQASPDATPPDFRLQS